MRKKTTGVGLIAVGCIFLISAAALMFHNISEDRHAGTDAVKVMEQLNSVLPDDMTTPDASPAPDFYEPLDPNRTMPTVEIDGYFYIGKLSIPALELELPVMDTWDYKRMKIAPCRYAGSAYLNNLVICAHNYTSHFGRLKNLSPGDAVTFTDMDGNEFLYEVKEIQTLSRTAVEEMKSGKWDLTLFTCTIGGRARVTVRCELAENGGEKPCVSSEKKNLTTLKQRIFHSSLVDANSLMTP